MPKDRKGTYEAILLRIIENKRKIEITPFPSEYVGMNTMQHSNSRNLRPRLYFKTACLILISGI